MPYIDKLSVILCLVFFRFLPDFLSLSLSLSLCCSLSLCLLFCLSFSFCLLAFTHAFSLSRTQLLTTHNDDVIVHQSIDGLGLTYSAQATAAATSSAEGAAASIGSNSNQQQLQFELQQQHSPTSSISKGRTELLLGDQTLRQER